MKIYWKVFECSRRVSSECFGDVHLDKILISDRLVLFSKRSFQFRHTFTTICDNLDKNPETELKIKDWTKTARNQNLTNLQYFHHDMWLWYSPICSTFTLTRDCDTHQSAVHSPLHVTDTHQSAVHSPWHMTVILTNLQYFHHDTWLWYSPIHDTFTLTRDHDTHQSGVPSPWPVTVILTNLQHLHHDTWLWYSPICSTFTMTRDWYLPIHGTFTMTCDWYSPIRDTFTMTRDCDTHQSAALSPWHVAVMFCSLRRNAMEKVLISASTTGAVSCPVIRTNPDVMHCKNNNRA